MVESKSVTNDLWSDLEDGQLVNLDRSRRHVLAYLEGHEGGVQSTQEGQEGSGGPGGGAEHCQQGVCTATLQSSANRGVGVSGREVLNKCYLTDYYGFTGKQRLYGVWCMCMCMCMCIYIYIYIFYLYNFQLENGFSE